MRIMIEASGRVHRISNVKTSTYVPNVGEDGAEDGTYTVTVRPENQDGDGKNYRRAESWA